MKKIAEYFRLIVFVASMLIGIQAPSFVNQYGKSLESHLRESNLGLQEFQADADKFFSGDLLKLIQHYQKTEDRVFNAGGESIETLYQRNQLLKSTSYTFTKDTFSSYVTTLKNPVPDILDEVRENYTYSIIIDKIAILLGAIFGFISLCLLFILNLFGRVIKPSKK